MWKGGRGSWHNTCFFAIQPAGLRVFVILKNVKTIAVNSFHEEPIGCHFAKIDSSTLDLQVKLCNILKHVQTALIEHHFHSSHGHQVELQRMQEANRNSHLTT